MKIFSGSYVRLIDIDYSKAFYVDWLSSREAVSGDIVLVESVFDTDGGMSARLLCEPRPGFLEWRADIHVSDFRCELIVKQSPPIDT